MNLQSETIKLAPEQSVLARKRLKKAAQILFVVAVIGQMMFVYHIVSFYGGTTLAGETDTWNDQLMNGLIEGDLWGNIALIVHLILAAVITFGGPLQFVAPLRKRFPIFHRWNGRLYVVTAILISLAGLYMIFARGVIGGKIMAAGNVINASMIIFFAIKMWHTAAVKRDFVAHKRWALRTFLVVSGVWFFRIGYGLWIAVSFGNPSGVEEDLTGYFDRFLAFAHALLPLAILELYFWVKHRNQALEMYGMMSILGVLSIALAVGIGMAAMIFWI
ncbi:MAG: DUF2306 domain-containing protein [Saprospiraceae bacterium]